MISVANLFSIKPGAQEWSLLGKFIANFPSHKVLKIEIAYRTQVIRVC